MAKETLVEQLNKLKTTLKKWENDLIAYKDWAIQNDGVLSTEEMTEINQRKEDIALVLKRINQIEKVKTGTAVTEKPLVEFFEPKVTENELNPKIELHNTEDRKIELSDDNSHFFFEYSGKGIKAGAKISKDTPKIKTIVPTPFPFEIGCYGKVELKTSALKEGEKVGLAIELSGSLVVFIGIGNIDVKISLRAEGSINGETSFGLYRDNPNRSGDTFEIALFANAKIVGEFLKFSYEEPLIKVPVGKLVVKGLLVSVDTSQIDLTAIASAAKKVAEVLWEKAVNKTAETVGDVVEYLGGPKNPMEIEQRIKEGDALYYQLLEDRKKLLYSADIKPFCNQPEFDVIDNKLSEFNRLLSEDKDKDIIVDSFISTRNSIIELFDKAKNRKIEHQNKVKAKELADNEELTKLKTQDSAIDVQVKYGKLGGCYAEAQGPGNVLFKKIHEDQDEKRKANAKVLHNKGFKHWDNANKAWQKRLTLSTDNVENLKTRIELGNHAISEYLLSKEEWMKGKNIY